MDGRRRKWNVNGWCRFLWATSTSSSSSFSSSFSSSTFSFTLEKKTIQIVHLPYRQHRFRRLSLVFCLTVRDVSFSSAIQLWELPRIPKNPKFKKTNNNNHLKSSRLSNSTWHLITTTLIQNWHICYRYDLMGRVVTMPSVDLTDN